jgi:predicted nucleic acid-binding protein
VKVYFDTNVLVAATIERHPHYPQSFDLLKAVKDRRLKGCVSIHGLAEFYSVLTRAPFNPRVHPAEAGRLLDDNLLPYWELTTPSAEDYKWAFRTSIGAGVTGGIVFDALHLRCAERTHCERVYTFNLRDFRALAPAKFACEIVSP